MPTPHRRSLLSLASACCLLPSLLIAQGEGVWLDNNANVTNSEVDFPPGVLRINSELVEDLLDAKLTDAEAAATYAPIAHSHTSDTLSGIDISADTNLAGDSEIVLTGGTLSLAGTIARDAEVAAGYAAIGHNHNATYSLIGHNHDASYSPIAHTHTGTTVSGIDISDDTNLAGTASEITLTGDTLSAHAALTRDSEWDTAAEINGATTDADFLTTLNVDTSAELAAILGDETGTGAVVLASNPTISTKLTVTPVATVSSALQVNHSDSSTRLQFGVHPTSTGYAGGWFGSLTASGTNYSFIGDGANELVFNAPPSGKLRFRLGHSTHSLELSNNIARLQSGTQLGWASTTDAEGTTDTAIGRNAAGVVEINNGTAGTYRDLQLRNVIASGTGTFTGTISGSNLSGTNTGDQTRASLGATTVGESFFTLANPGAITFPRVNANNSVSALNAADFRAAIGAPWRATTTLGSAAADITISSIPAGYRALRIIINARSNAASRETIYLRFNGDTGNNYLWSQFYTENSTSSAFSPNALVGAAEVAWSPTVSGTSASAVVEVADYANTTFHKNFVADASDYEGTLVASRRYGGTWKSTAAVNQVQVYAATGNLVTGSTVTVIAE